MLTAEEIRKITKEHKKVEKRDPETFVEKVATPAIRRAANKGFDFIICEAGDFWLSEKEYNHSWENKFYRPFARKVKEILESHGFKVTYRYLPVENSIWFEIVWDEEAWNGTD